MITIKKGDDVSIHLDRVTYCVPHIVVGGDCDGGVCVYSNEHVIVFGPDEIMVIPYDDAVKLRYRVTQGTVITIT